MLHLSLLTSTDSGKCRLSDSSDDDEEEEEEEDIDDENDKKPERRGRLDSRNRNSGKPRRSSHSSNDVYRKLKENKGNDYRPGPFLIACRCFFLSLFM